MRPPMPVSRPLFPPAVMIEQRGMVYFGDSASVVGVLGTYRGRVTILTTVEGIYRNGAIGLI